MKLINLIVFLFIVLLGGANCGCSEDKNPNVTSTINISDDSTGAIRPLHCNYKLDWFVLSHVASVSNAHPFISHESMC